MKAIHRVVGVALASAAAPSVAENMPAPAPMAPAVTVEGRAVFDVMTVPTDATRSVQALAEAEIRIEADLDRIVHLRGLRAGMRILGTAGGHPNDLVATMQGVDNIEVGDHRLKLYEFWIEQAIAADRGSVRLGLTDLNAEFYANDAAGLLVAPPFGIGSELAATGPNGPSIFPSTALTARLDLRVGATGYFRAAAVDAKAGVLGDQSGIDFSMRDGALLIAEAGSIRRGKLAFGYWRYTRRQGDIRDGSTARLAAQGAYVLGEYPLTGSRGSAKGIDLFARTGMSDGRTTPYRGGFQFGLLVRGLMPARPAAQFSAGMHAGFLSRGYRQNLRDGGDDAGNAEVGVEITCQDRIGRFLTVQPDLQYVRRPVSGEADKGVLIFGVRLIVEGGAG
ncbi:MAG: carbohydrate porin [Pseudomonadota bacterium]